jgi:hypothetical protein
MLAFCRPVAGDEYLAEVPRAGYRYDLREVQGA